MHRKPTQRRHFRPENMEMNLTPMMNLITILIPILLVSTVFVEIAVVDIGAPGNDAPASAEQPTRPLALTVHIGEKGYYVSIFGDILPNASGSKDDPTLLTTQKDVDCKAYLGMAPPPRRQNARLKPCPKNAIEAGQQRFWIYDAKALQNLLAEIKNDHPNATRITLSAEPDIEYESLIDVIDAAREIKDVGGETRPLFGDVLVDGNIAAL